MRVSLMVLMAACGCSASAHRAAIENRYGRELAHLNAVARGEPAPASASFDRRPILDAVTYRGDHVDTLLLEHATELRTACQDEMGLADHLVAPVGEPQLTSFECHDIVSERAIPAVLYFMRTSDAPSRGYWLVVDRASLDE